MGERRRTRDFYARRAKRENYPARSVYKLEEIDRKVRLLRKGDRVLDLGAAPGSWSLYASQKVGPNGTVVSVDLSALSVGLPENIVSIEADVLTLDPESLSVYGGEKGFDAVISDMAPHTTGNRFVDQSRSFELFDRAAEIAAILARPGGRFVGKIFHGGEFQTARDRVRDIFTKVQIMKPASIRSESYEIYIVGLNRR
ncbi:MAG: RlmE family RNA methyltransferase [Proteobacteria bacterium]|nr:RlmE family RNA methyltransferase [Pseudomonadota bacterium]